MRDPLMTGYAPHPVSGVTPEQRIEVRSRKVACEGEGNGALGHPRIWLHVEDREVTCPYCSITYVLAEGAGEDHGH
ncbi:zinc-finger domain-containing protein [Roseomonas alkaliterrae]|uniref:Putative Zn-finger protein n=1 Tax=Neoroseomonas alkaliterrae TaxID=1452450 RepID=A0A840XKB7_9PROT|nr:zinc-finger domain-containing protein [Neoroseomonas alkaliterrae]MBB5688336.1 putative Zn-finger protein [Neoroseomonas alkaliterrae]MBR0677239.1 zinc-finger domain-containing protein [Neoroseomonas alkaliterrae]